MESLGATSTQSVIASWRERVGFTGVLVAAVLNVAMLILCLLVLGHALGWLAPGRFDRPSTIGYGLPFLQMMLFAYLLDQLFRFFVRRWAETEAIGRAPPRLGLQLGRMLVYFVMLAISISMVFNRSLTGILAASGIVGLVMGFALRGLVSDLFFGIALHIDRNLSIGDWVDVSFRGRDVSGQVMDIHWRSVILHDTADNLVLVPNSEFASAVVINRSKPNIGTEYSTSISIGSEYESSRVLNALEMVLATLTDDHVILHSPAPRAQIAQVENGIVRYRMTYSVLPRSGIAQEAQSAAMRYALQYLRAAGCYLYPQMPNYVNPDKMVTDRPHDFAVRQRIIANVPLFRVLPSSVIEVIAREAEVENYPTGAVLVRAGEPGDTMWIIGEGGFDVLVNRDGVDIQVTSLWPGDWVGEMGLLAGEPRTATVRAKTPSLVYALKKPVMEQLFEADPKLISALAQIAGRRRKERDRPLASLSPSQDLAKTKSIVARIRIFFGMPEAE
jgi:small-conductance mechanosensitive channel/CRP-like cAMP-binding protein